MSNLESKYFIYPSETGSGLFMFIAILVHRSLNLPGDWSQGNHRNKALSDTKGHARDITESRGRPSIAMLERSETLKPVLSDMRTHLTFKVIFIFLLVL